MTEFNGFPQEIDEFFMDLQDNNNREWFNAHKRDYEDYVKQPACEFVVAMGEKLRNIAPRINAVPKINQSLFRLNRDTRFAKDKRPYKTDMGIWFWEGERKRMECSGFYLHFGEGKLMIGAGMYIIPRDMLEQYREAVVDKKLGPRLQKAVDHLSNEGYAIKGQHYKKVPRGYDAAHKNVEYLLHNGLHAGNDIKTPKEFYSKTLLDYALARFEKMLPLHMWLMEALGFVQ